MYEWLEYGQHGEPQHDLLRLLHSNLQPDVYEWPEYGQHGERHDLHRLYDVQRWRHVMLCLCDVPQLLLHETTFGMHYLLHAVLMPDVSHTDCFAADYALHLLRVALQPLRLSLHGASGCSYFQRLRMTEHEPQRCERPDLLVLPYVGLLSLLHAPDE